MPILRWTNSIFEIDVRLLRRLKWVKIRHETRHDNEKADDVLTATKKWSAIRQSGETQKAAHATHATDHSSWWLLQSDEPRLGNLFNTGKKDYIFSIYIYIYMFSILNVIFFHILDWKSRNYTQLNFVCIAYLPKRFLNRDPAFCSREKEARETLLLHAQNHATFL
jgi:hypothetical protein